MGLRSRPEAWFACLAAAALLAAAPGASAAPKKQTAKLGAVKATFSFDEASSGALRYSNLNLVIRRRGKVAFDGPVQVGQGTGPAATRGRSVSVRRLDAGREPEVILKLYTGGAHCCTLSVIYRRTSKGYKAVQRDWADAGYRVRNVGGSARPEFLTADARNFAYRYASFADSLFPIQVLRYHRGRFRDVTRRFPRLIRRDLRRQERAYRDRVRMKGYPRGALAAVVADHYLLGRGAAARALLRKALKKGTLRRRASFDPPPYGKAYIRALLRHLKRTGYRR